jgi:hypothetical protein
MRWPGIEPGSTAWKAAMLTIIPPTLDMKYELKTSLNLLFNQKVKLSVITYWYCSHSNHTNCLK